MPIWRPLLYYATAVIGGAVYGGQVCPLMVRLPVWLLGIIIFIPMIAAWLLRPYLQRKLVDAAPSLRQPLRQFQMDVALFIASSLGSALILLVVYNFPLLLSGSKLVLGIFTVGLFAGLDTSLARERLNIGRALSGEAAYAPPERIMTITRKFSMISLLILGLSTGIILLVIIRDMNWLAEQDLNMFTIEMLSRSVLIEILFVMGFLTVMVTNLVASYTRNLRILFNLQTRVLENVTNGDLSRRVPVTTSDELGVIAGHTNAMIASLREGERMRDGLRIAREVQQHFLPRRAPEMPGLDIAGASLFSDETGGDFFDFVACEADSCGQLAVAVGDVSGHGIGAALLMTAGRAIIRQNAATPGSPAENIRRANMHLTRDIGETGRFLTLFFMVVDPIGELATWVNAGHQPPQLYDPATDAFTELKGQDIPLGVEPEWEYHEQVSPLPRPGQVLCICTDGVWEAHDGQGNMFGRDRLREILRENHARSAEDILHAINDRVLEFSGPGRREDDLTLVIIKGVER